MKQIVLKVNHLKKDSKSYITDYLGTLGIKPEDVDSFINVPRNEDEADPELLEGINEAADVLVSKINQNPNISIFIQVDADTDGFTSSAILINYLRRRFPTINIQWRLHDGKQHGVIVDTVPEDCEIVIIPDAGSNQFTEHKQLKEKGKTIIVLDHHEISDMEHYHHNSDAYIVNNQTSPKFPNKSLSGAGVVYKFIKLIDRKYFSEQQTIYKDYGDLAAIGIIADAMNMTTLDNNYIAYYGLQNVHSQFIHEVALKQSRGIKNPDSLTKIDVAFYIAPVINGVIRSGSPEDKQMVFRALTEENNTEMFEHTWRGVTKMETLYQAAARMAANAKSRQDSAKKKSFEWLCGEIRDKGLDRHNIIIATLDAKQSSKVSPNVTGLIAMELVKEFNKPCLVLRETDYEGEKVYGGSGRNGNFYKLPDLKSMLAAAGGLYQEGHANAFGSFLRMNQVDDIRAYFDSHLDSSVFDDLVYEVDYWFHTGEPVDGAMLEEIAEYDYLWGNSIPQPKFAIDMNFTPDQLFVMGADKSSMKLTLGPGVSAVAFKNPELIDQLQNTPNAHLTIVGRPQINEYMGRRSVQMIIDDIKVEEVKASNISIASLI